jgi:hypothetical protein
MQLMCANSRTTWFVLAFDVQVLNVHFSHLESWFMFLGRPQDVFRYLFQHCLRALKVGPAVKVEHALQVPYYYIFP